jgi:hypothetical protein
MMDNEKEILCSPSVPASVEWREHERMKRAVIWEIVDSEGPMPSVVVVKSKRRFDGISRLYVRTVKSAFNSNPKSSLP